MKILHLITSLKIGGAESALYNFLEYVVNGPDEHIVVYFHDGPNSTRIAQLGIKTVHIKGFLSPYDAVGLWRLNKCIIAHKPTLIHSALWSANILGRLFAKLHHVPIICDLHGNSFDEGWLRNFLERRTTHLSSKIVAVSKNTHDVYLKNIINHLSNSSLKTQITQKLVIINNGINPAALTHQANINPLSRHDLGLSEDDFVIGTVGRLEPIKSYDVLIEAFSYLIHEEKIAHAKLCIVGGGSQEGMLKNLAVKLNVDDRTIFIGQQENPCRFYPIFNCFALSSQSEGMSIALLEALAFGLPIVTTNNHPTHDVIQHGVNGFIVPPQQPKIFAQHLKSLIKNKQITAKMHLENINLSSNSYSLERTALAFKKLYTGCK